MSSVLQKEDAHKIIDQLDDNATWDDLMQEIFIKETIAQGIEDSKNGRVTEVSQVRAKYGLPI